MNVVILVHIDKRQRAKVVADEGDIGGQSGDSLIHVFERLEIGEVDHHKKGLLEWITDNFSFLQD